MVTAFPVREQNSGARASNRRSARTSIHRRSSDAANGSMPTVRDRPPLANSTRTVPLSRSMSLGWSISASEMRSPAR